MKKFSDFNIIIENDKKLFDCKQISITEIINCEIIIIDVEKDIKTKHGEFRYLLYLSVNNDNYKVFTNSENLKKTINLIDVNDFPFSTTIKTTKYGNKTIYKFT